jgi:hypothetical protein
MELDNEMQVISDHYMGLSEEELKANRKASPTRRKRNELAVSS